MDGVVYGVGEKYSKSEPCLPSRFQNLRQQVLELLGPISMNHGAHFMAAIAYVWNERKQAKAPVRTKVGSDQEALCPAGGAEHHPVLTGGFCFRLPWLSTVDFIHLELIWMNIGEYSSIHHPFCVIPAYHVTLIDHF